MKQCQIDDDLSLFGCTETRHTNCSLKGLEDVKWLREWASVSQILFFRFLKRFELECPGRHVNPWWQKSHNRPFCVFSNSLVWVDGSSSMIKIQLTLKMFLVYFFPPPHICSNNHILSFALSNILNKNEDIFISYFLVSWWRLYFCIYQFKKTLVFV